MENPSDQKQKYSTKINVDEILEGFLCEICMKSMVHPTITKCGHTMCKECIFEVINRQHECPMCMTQLKSFDQDTTRNYALEKLLNAIQFERQKEIDAHCNRIAQGAIDSVMNDGDPKHIDHNS